eukprot:4392480-Prymnesium_polylepis.2
MARAQNLDPGALAPVVSYEEGTDAEVTWAIAIKHPAAYTESGVRIALSYNGESFDRNVLAGGVGQAIAFTPLSAGPSEPGGDAGRAVVSLPAGKTCDACVLQFVWAAAPGTDGPQGGYYISCADVTIRARKARQHSRKVDHLMLSIFVSAVVFAVLSCVTRWLKQRWAAEEEEDALRRERESQSPDMRAMDMAIDEFELQAAAAKSGMRQCESSTTRLQGSFLWRALGREQRLDVNARDHM